jgi:hypothetical protein
MENTPLKSLFLQIEQITNPWPSRELINFVVHNPSRINGRAKISPYPDQTLLHRAAFLGRRELVEWLVRKNADINVMDGDGYTPLDCANSVGEMEIVAFLKKRGAKSGVKTIIAKSNMAPVNTTANYMGNQEGTFTDNNTGLMWMRCPLGQTWNGDSCIGVATACTWNGAKAAISTFAGYSDWRLPTINELKNIVDNNLKAIDLPTCIKSTFTKSQGQRLWSSTLVNNRPDFAAFIYVGDGTTHSSALLDKHFSIYVRSTEPAPPEISNIHSEEKSSSNYHDNNDGTVTDTRTGLTWMRCALGQTWDASKMTCIGTASGITWQKAKAMDYKYPNINGWRLPSLVELKSILDSSRTSPAIDTLVFPETPSAYFWTNEIELSSTAWGVDFNLGGTASVLRAFNNHVRLVRENKQSILSRQPADSGALIQVTTKPSSQSALQETAQVPQPQSNITPIAAPGQGHNFDKMIERLDRLENRFENSSKRIELLVESISSNNNQTLKTIENPPENSNINHVVLLEGLSQLEKSIERIEIRFDVAINRIEMVLKSLFSGQSAVKETMAQHQQAFNANADKIAAEFAELRQMFALAIQPVIRSPAPNASQQIINQATQNAAPISMGDHLKWLVEYRVISLSDLRNRLLPLDLLPSAFINDINEQALDLVGEVALIDEGDSIEVQRAVLEQVISIWRS